MRAIYVYFWVMGCLVALTFAQETGQVIITEIMYDPASSETTEETQYIEIANTTPNPINLNGWTIDDEDSDGPNTLPNVTLPPYGIAIICGGSQADFEGAWGSGYLIISLKDNGQTMFNMSNTPSNTSEIIQLRDNNGVLVDEVNYDDAAPWPNNNNQSSIYLAIPKDQMNATSNNDGANWAISVSGVDGARTASVFGVWDSGADVGSPGNILGDDALPVTLRSFQASAGDGMVKLKWITEAEVNNLGFEILRSTTLNGPYELISSYTSNPDLRGQYTTNQRTEYRFLDQLVINGTTYYYKLIDVSANGRRTPHGPVSATPGENALLLESNTEMLPQQFMLYPNFPNPFNPTTTIKFEIAPVSEGSSAVPVMLRVINLSGQQVSQIFSGKLAPGSYQMTWRARSQAGTPLPGGIYFLQLITPYFQRSVKMVLLK